MWIAEWIIYLMITCFCIFSLGIGSVAFVIAVNGFADRKTINK